MSGDREATERRLLAEADYVYAVDGWEVTHDDFGDLSECVDLAVQYDGEITTVGRLKSLPNAYAVNLPTAFDDEGDPEDWEVTVFETREAAKAAYADAMATGSKALGEQSNG